MGLGGGCRPSAQGSSAGRASPAGRNRLRSVTRTWDPTMPGVVRLPSGRLVRGRGLRRQMPEGPLPDFGLYLLGKPPAGTRWDSRWLCWPDFRLPADQGDARDALRDAWRRAADGRVEVACGGGAEGRALRSPVLPCWTVYPLMRPSLSCESTTTLGRSRRLGSAATSCDSSPPDGVSVADRPTATLVRGRARGATSSVQRAERRSPEPSPRCSASG